MADYIGPWGVRLHGPAELIQFIQDVAVESGSDFRIETDDGQPVLRHPSLQGEAQHAADRAEELIAALNGYSLLAGLQGVLGSGPLVRDGNVTVVVGTGYMTLPMIGGRPAQDRLFQDALAVGDTQTEEALRYLAASEDAKRVWVELYKVYEVIERSVGNVVAAGLIDNAADRLFRRTANSRNTATRDSARHSDRFEPPEKPMEVGEARRLIRRMLRAWIGRVQPSI